MEVFDPHGVLDPGDDAAQIERLHRITGVPRIAIWDEIQASRQRIAEHFEHDA